MVLRRRLWVLLAAATMAALMLVAAKDVSAAPPVPVDTTPFTLPEGFACDYPLQAELSGKSKLKDLPGGRTLSISPGLRVPLTNLEEPTNQASYVVPGPFLFTARADGTTFVVARGRNIIFGPEVGMFLTIGRFTYIAQNELPITRPTGNGRLIDVCAQLA